MAKSLNQALSGTYVLLPSLGHCVPAVERQDSAKVVEDSQQWCRQGLVNLLPPADLTTLLAERASLWTVFVLPTAPYDFLVAAARYTEYLSILDNALVDKERLGSDAVYATTLKAAIDVVFDGGAPGASVDEEMATWFKPLIECLSTLRGYLTDEVWASLHREVYRFFVGCVEEVRYRNSATVYDFETYLRMRRNSVGMGMYFALGEALAPPISEASGAEHKQRLLAHALDHIALTNDLYSFRAEAEADDVVNAVATLILSERLTVQEAFDRVGLEVLRNENAFRKQLHDAVAELGADHPVNAYGALLWHMMCGNVEWSYRTTRYNGEGHEWDGRYPQVVQLLQGSTRFTRKAFRDLVAEGLV
ncbi:terpene synthase family protein [Micromonospora sp. R77]|uniref:terpene synthase family protein n=1 Tax=Micromonospora sp. R77 TaxID=2925836 RepID=UPI001F61750E|nr:terpene synthase family protein [Micromonospora sp. R77]MCI4061457.1 terpene synthase family protein [Micromonospora sp. R77]